MTHNEERQSWMKEGAIGLAVGVLYGTTNVMAGHPFDTIKTKMQAQHGFENEGMVKSFTKTLRAEGIRGVVYHHYVVQVFTDQHSLLSLKQFIHYAMILAQNKSL